MRDRRWSSSAALVATLFVVLAGVREPVEAQVVWRDFVVTGGMAMEEYQGNLSAVTVPVVDSTNDASAAVGQFGVRGDLLLMNGDSRRLELGFDGGLRQFEASGFELRDYAPREWVGTLDLGFSQRVDGVGVLRAQTRFRGRRVEDRPPMPLFLQPGYSSASGALSMNFRPIGGVRLDAKVSAETSDYRAPNLFPQLDLLDRHSVGGEAGATWGSDNTLRLWSAFRQTRYPEQSTFDPDDPSRRDRTARVGATWTLQSTVMAQLGVEGVVNRSNSSRPEYDAVSLRGLFSTPLPWRLGLDLYAVLTKKSYVHDTEFARLVPGEEADDATVVYLSLTRPVVETLDAAVRVGWTRAETEIGDSYYRRFSTAVFFHYRPWRR